MPSWLHDVPTILISVPLTFLFLWISFSLKEKFFPSFGLELSEEENLEYIQSVANEVVRSGQASYDEMLEIVEDAALDSSLDKSDAKAALDAEVASLIKEQENWPDVTEVERLQLAFKNLESVGYYTDFGEICCGTCGFANAKSARKKNPEMLGHIFFTSQDIDAALQGVSICFWYGARTKKYVESTYLKVATDLYEALNAEGLTPEWDGTSKDQVRLPINWQVRWGESRAKLT